MNPFENNPDMTPLLMSFTDAWVPGCIQTPCDNCPNLVWEQQANIDLIRAKQGMIICEYCVAAVNTHSPGLLPAFEGQLWQGEFRAEPHMTPEMEQIILHLEALRTRTKP